MFSRTLALIFSAARIAVRGGAGRCSRPSVRARRSASVGHPCPRPGSYAPPGIRHGGPAHPGTP
jgi:hypothetical protein